MTGPSCNNIEAVRDSAHQVLSTLNGLTVTETEPERREGHPQWTWYEDKSYVAGLADKLIPHAIRLPGELATLSAHLTVPGVLEALRGVNQQAAAISYSFGQSYAEAVQLMAREILQRLFEVSEKLRIGQA